MSEGPFEMICANVTNTVVGSVNSCTNVVEYNTGYHYNITLWSGALFTALFALTTIAHLIQAVMGKRWFVLCTVFLCGVGETLGWAGRLAGAVSTEWRSDLGGYWYSNDTAFLIQIAVLVLAPAFLAAGWYIMLGKLIAALGPQYCRFNRKTYAIAFVLGDVVSICIQAVGGGLAAGAETSAEADEGATIMVAGVIIQMVIMVLYSILLSDTIYHFLAKRPVKPFRFRKTQDVVAVQESEISHRDVRNGKILIGAMVASTLLVFIRSIYRTIELLQGWSGPIISNQTLFVILDAVMVFLALAIFNVISPSKYLPRVPLAKDAEAVGGVVEKNGDATTPMSENSDRTLDGTVTQKAVKY